MSEAGDDGAAWDNLIEAYDGLMCGWANFAPATAEEDFEGGSALIVATAEDGDEFDRLARELIVNAGHEFVGTERLRWLTTWARVPHEVFPLAAEAVETGAAAAAFVTWTEADPLWERELNTVEWNAIKTGAALVEIVTDESQLVGFLLDFSDALVLVQHVDSTAVLLDGYSVYPRTEVLRFEPAPETFVPEALRRKGQLVDPIDAPLAGLPEFFRWVGDVAPLVSVHEARENPEGYTVGAVVGVTDDAVTVRGVDKRGRWVDEFAYEFREVTRVDFLDNYLSALALVAGERP